MRGREFYHDSVAKFIVSRMEEAYDAHTRRLTEKFRLSTCKWVRHSPQGALKLCEKTGCSLFLYSPWRRSLPLLSSLRIKSNLIRPSKVALHGHKCAALHPPCPALPT